MSKNSLASLQNYRDEIDLIDFFSKIWRQKWLMLVCAGAVSIAATAYAFLSAPIYEAHAKLLPPRLSDIAGFNLGRKEASLSEFTVQDVYGVFRRNLFSDALKRDFFRTVYLPSVDQAGRAMSQDELSRQFNESLVVRVPDLRNNPGLFEVIFQHGEPRIAAEWVNRFVDMARKKTEADMRGNLLAEIGTKAQAIERQIEVLRTAGDNQRNDRIVRLREALAVAEAVGLDSPQVTTGKTSSDNTLAPFMDGNLMYMRGAKAIRAELQVLQKRESNDPFIPRLRDLENQLGFLRSVSVDPENVSVFTLDSEAEIPETPVKPRRDLVIAIGLILGGILGFLVAAIRVCVSQKVRDRKLEH
ncbi:Chain length determinant protein [compost metagenome]